MKELLSTNDVVFLSYVEDVLRQEGIDYALFDTNMSVIEGSIGILPRRIMVSDECYEDAYQMIKGQMIKGANGQLKGVLECEGQETKSQEMMALLDQDELTDDLFLGGALKIYQPKKGFRSGIDAILLAASVPDHGSMRVLEAGCGAGVVSLAIAQRCKTAQVDAIEIEQINTQIAQANVERNGLQERVSIFLGDLCDPVTKLELLGLKRNSYDFVVANPPFYDEGAMRFSSDPLRRRAKRAMAETLEEWVRFLTAMAAPKGVISMIHRAEKLDEVLSVLTRRFGGVKVLPLFPKPGEPANRVIVQGVKGSRAPMVLLQGVVLHDEQGHYCAQVKDLCAGPNGLKQFT